MTGLYYHGTWWSRWILRIVKDEGKDRKNTGLLEKPYSRDIKEDWGKQSWDIFSDICPGLCLSRGDRFRECAENREVQVWMILFSTVNEEMFWSENKSGTWGRERDGMLWISGGRESSGVALWGIKEELERGTGVVSTSLIYGWIMSSESEQKA